jgi:DHA1 family tetracycline resistance protein-like MFS transporter
MCALRAPGGKQMRQRTLWTLYACNLLASIGFWFFLPLLPIFLARRGGSAALVGAVFASGLLANALIRYPAGWAADRFGTRPVMIAALAAEAILFLAYLPHLPLAAFVAVRFLHGASAGAFWPAANGLIAEVAPPKELGGAFGVMQSTNMAGMIIGPAIGGFIALFNLGVVFVVAAIVSGLAALAILTIRNVRTERTLEAPLSAQRIARALLPLIFLGAGTSYMIGTFDTVWSLYMTYRGATTFAVGFSFATFGIAALLVSARAGALGDRFGARKLIVGSLVVTALFASLYPFIASVPWLIGLGLIEGAFTISGAPSLIAEVSRHAEPGHQGRTQGVFQTIQTSIQIVGSIAGGYLFTISPTYAFLAITAFCLLGAASPLLPWRQRRPRSVAHVVEPPPAV